MQLKYRHSLTKICNHSNEPTNEKQQTVYNCDKRSQYIKTHHAIDVAHHLTFRGRRNRDPVVVGCIITYAISAYQQKCREFDSHLGEVYLIQHYVIKVINDLR